MNEIHESQGNKESNSTAPLVLGIIGLIISFIPFVNYASGVLALVGLILGIISITKSKKKKKAVTATIICIIAGIMAIVMPIVYAGMFVSSVSDSVNKTSKENNTPVSVAYEVSGTSTSASITYSTYANGNSGTEQTTGQTLPFTKTVTGTKGWSGYTLTASNGYDDSGAISCKITVADKVVSEQTSTGSFATVSCSSSTGDASSSK